MGTWESSRKSWRKMAFLLSPSVLGLAAVAGLVIYLLFFSKPKLPPGTKKLPGPKGIPLLGSVQDLLVKRAAKYSGRVHFSAIWGDCATDGHYLPLMTSCPDHKRIKTFARKIIAGMSKERLSKVATEQTNKMILKLLQDPESFGPLLEKCCGGISSAILGADPTLGTGFSAAMACEGDRSRYI